jgi:hypothetical protein
VSRYDGSLLVFPAVFRLELKSLLGQMFKNILQDVNAEKCFITLTLTACKNLTNRHLKWICLMDKKPWNKMTEKEMPRKWNAIEYSVQKWYALEWNAIEWNAIEWNAIEWNAMDLNAMDLNAMD